MNEQNPASNCGVLFFKQFCEKNVQKKTVLYDKKNIRRSVYKKQFT